MLRYWTLSVFCMVSAVQLFAQSSSLYLPKNFESSYLKGIRSRDGNPGPKYWQNRSEYQLDVSLNPSTKKVNCKQSARYFNDSPDTLRMLRIKVLHDFYRKGAQRAEEVNPEDVNEGPVIHRLAVNGLAVQEKKQKRHDSYLDIRLEKALLPNSSLLLELDWTYKMPEDKAATRECVCTPGSFFVSYFYPEIAVYDDLHGWADAPYNGLQEFYHDFSNYDVRITVPKGFAVWATGEWQNAGQMLTPEVLSRWKKAHDSKEVVQVFSSDELKSGKVFAARKKQTFHFSARETPDFAFAVSNHYNWDACAAVVDDRDGRKAFISAAYDDNSRDFRKVARIAADGVELMSRYLPGYPFPYPSLTVFNGNDGMEYPMMINDASTTEDGVMGLTIHEAAHSYFPFMMGINEQYYAWMDEGWANFFEHFTSDSLRNTQSGIWGGMLGNDWDVPPFVASRNLSSNTYWLESYTRPQIAYTQLYDLLGYDGFHRCMTAYIDRWKGKHPGPYEFFNTFNDVSGQNLDWFWKPWFFEFGYPDLSLKLEEETSELIVGKVGIMPVPVHLTLQYSDGAKEVRHFPASVWKDPGTKELRVAIPGGKALKKASVGSKTIPDVNTKDNRWEKK